MMINHMKVFLCIPTKNMTLRESEELAKSYRREVSETVPGVRHSIVNPIPRSPEYYAKLQKLSDLIWYLNESDCAFFTKGWESDTDCQIINTICLNYGIRRYYHNEEDYPYGQ